MFCANDVGRRVVLFDQGGALGAAADRFQGQGSGAGKEIDRVFSADVRPDQVENRLAEAVFHGPGAEIAAIVQPPAAKCSPDDPQPRGGPNDAARHAAPGGHVRFFRSLAHRRSRLRPAFGTRLSEAIHIPVRADQFPVYVARASCRGENTGKMPVLRQTRHPVEQLIGPASPITRFARNAHI